jgi:hypothetical protein
MKEAMTIRESGKQGQPTGDAEQYMNGDGPDRLGLIAPNVRPRRATRSRRFG